MKIKGYFSRGEIALLCGSLALIIISNLFIGEPDPMSLVASLIGAVSLIYCAKGHPLGQLLMIAFSILYGIISYAFRYYGEMITYLGMTLPMAVLSLISWVKNPYRKGESEVRVDRLGRREVPFIILLTAAVTLAFYFILSSLGTANILFSTLSVTTSFAAVYLTFRRSPYYALAYAANDVILLVLWVPCAVAEPSYLSVVICFVTFLINDIYGFISWRRMARRQGLEDKEVEKSPLGA
ncbi:MAG: nicotinamide mononucleotide transporter [Clostridia bacterium]|nr:nicotinamide mononucleotide transporter [Clostridia bacterium]